MLIAHNVNLELVRADRCGSGEQFYCPACKNKVILKQGSIKRPHFAHLNVSDCETFSENESLLHLESKYLLEKTGRELGWNCTLEKVFSNISQRADLFIQSGDQSLAIEFQQSPISDEEIFKRNSGYERIGLPFVWLLGPNYPINKLKEHTAAKFSDRSGHIFCFDAKDNIRILKDFKKRDFLSLSFQIAKLDIKLFFAEISNYFYNGGFSNKVRFKAENTHIGENSFTHLRRLQTSIIKGRADKNKLTDIYCKTGKSPVCAPWFIHRGHQFGLLCDNWQWRLDCLLLLEERGADGLDKNMFIDFLTSKKYFYSGRYNHANAFAVKAAAQLLFEMKMSKLVFQKGDLIFLRDEYRWFKSYQEKISDRSLC